MPTWYYKGQTPSPVNVTGRGSVVMTRGSKFEATSADVARLVNSGAVVPVSVPKVAKTQSKEHDNTSVAPECLQQEAQVEPQVVEACDSDVDSVVVDVDLSTNQIVEAEAVQVDDDVPPEEKQSKSSKRGRRS